MLTKQKNENKIQVILSKVKDHFYIIIDHIDALDFNNVKMPKWFREYHNLTLSDIRQIHEITNLLWENRHDDIIALYTSGAWPYLPDNKRSDKIDGLMKKVIELIYTKDTNAS